MVLSLTTYEGIEGDLIEQFEIDLERRGRAKANTKR
jgi:hypothetical protein